MTPEELRVDSVAPQEINMPSEEFRLELAALLNRHSLESGSDTPDFLMADYLCGCIMAWNSSVMARDKWWGFRTWEKIHGATDDPHLPIFATPVPSPGTDAPAP